MKKIKFTFVTLIITAALCLASFAASNQWPFDPSSKNQENEIKTSMQKDKRNSSPIVESLSISTVVNVERTATIKAYDSDNNNFAIKLTSTPKLGTVEFNGSTFTYTPFLNKKGKDKFRFVAIDEMGNSSREGVVNIIIDKTKPDFYYSDMINNPSHYSAIKLKEKEIIVGKKIGKSYFFEPKNSVSREKFLVMAISAAGMEKKLKPTVNTGLANDIEIPNYLKPYVKLAIDEKIIPNSNFNLNEIPTRAEAVLLISNISKIPDVKSHNLTLSDIGQIPQWAMQAYMNLSAYKMLDLYDNMAHPNSPITNSNTADLMWQLYKHINR